MSITLKKQQKLSLKKENGLKLVNLRAELRWDAPEGTLHEFDADASAFVLKDDANGNKIALDNTTHFCFYGQQETPAISSSGDNRTGGGDGEDLYINLDKVPQDGKYVQIVVSIYDSIKRGQNLSQIENGYLRLVDVDNEKEIAIVKFEEMTPKDISMLFVEVYRTDGGWEIQNVNTGFDKELDKWTEIYKIDIS